MLLLTEREQPIIIIDMTLIAFKNVSTNLNEPSIEMVYIKIATTAVAVRVSIDFPIYHFSSA